MKQTAVEWFEIELKDNLGKIVINQNWQLLEKLINEAKEMEKEQIIEAYLKNHLQGCWMKNTPEEYAEQYYNETFKSE